MDYPKLAQGYLNLIGAWFGSCFFTLIFSLILLIYLSNDQKAAPKIQSYKLYQALPQSQIQVKEEVSFQDGRSKIVEEFFQNYHSVLASFAQDFILVADKYQLDFRLLPAIAMQESNGGKKMPEDSFNPFGFGIYGSRLIRFQSFEEAIETVALSLRKDYLNQGLATPEEIMTRYTPPSLSKGGAWAKGVSSFMEELR